MDVAPVVHNRREHPYVAGLVVVDRDGTLNVEKHYLSHPDLVELLANAVAGLSLLRAMGFSVASSQTSRR